MLVNIKESSDENTLSLKPFVGQKKVRKAAIVLQNTLLGLTIFRPLQKVYVICHKNLLY